MTRTRQLTSQAAKGEISLKKQVMMLTIAGMVGCASILGATSAQAAPIHVIKVDSVSSCPSIGNWNWLFWMKPIVPSMPQVEPDDNAQSGSDHTGNTGNLGNAGNSGNAGSVGNTGNTGSTGGTDSNSSETEDAVTVSVFAQKVTELVNQERATAGLSPVTLDTQLSEVAMLKAKDMVEQNYFSHQSPTYGSPFDMMRAHGITYQTAAENIAKGQKTAEEVMHAWMNSEGHRKNIMNSSFTKIGVAYYNGVWVQQFIG